MKYPLKISLIYFIFSFLWIYYSDSLLLSMSLNPEIMTFVQTIKGILFISISSIFLFFLIKNAVKKIEETSADKEKIINTLASPILIFNEDGKVLKVNKVFEKLTGYKHSEIDTIEKWTKYAHAENALEIKELINSLFIIENIVDNGEFTITTKDNKKIIWHFNSAPYGIKDGKKVIVSSALDVTQIRNKEKMLMQQSKMAAMGEILENIAHQWRQPLSAISTAATGVKLQSEYGTLNPKMLNESMEMINNSSQYLSKTIEDFRSFFKPNQNAEYFKIDYVMDKLLQIIGNKFSNEKIIFIQDIEKFQILNYSNALIQVLMNIFNNSKDAFEENKINDRFIFIDAFNDEYNVIIQIKDTAGGISSSIIKKVFEPYFTTKHQKKGTGIGLYMSEEIVSKHMNGNITVENRKFIYNNKTYTGAMFTITLPLKI